MPNLEPVFGELTPRRQARFGWRPDTPDIRDHFAAVKPVPLPPQVSLRGEFPAPYDQGQLGSCTANAGAAIFEHRQVREYGGEYETPSRLFIYYGERVLEHTVRDDSGAELRDCAKVLATVGAPPETLWPYDVEKFSKKPSMKAYRAAKKLQAIAYARLPQSAVALQTSLANGNPFMFGFSVYDSFESQPVATTGIVPMPSPSESVLGGHAVVGVGYKQINAQLYFEVRNSWGDGWGDAGHFYMPAGYISNPQLASDFWVVTQVEDGK